MGTAESTGLTEHSQPNPDRPVGRNRLAIGNWTWPFRALVVAAVLVAVGAVLSFYWFISPSDTVPERSDAVIVLLGGDGERLERAIDLMDADAAPTLVLSIDDWPWREWRAVMPYCLEAQEFEVICVTPDPLDTRGEAQTISNLANEQGWDRLVVVTSDYHVHRAEIHFDRCTDATVTMAPADTQFSVRRLAQEWAATIGAELPSRSC